MTGQLIYNIFLITVFIAASMVLATLFAVTAPYGRYIRKGWGPTIKSRIGWLIMEFPAFFIMILLFILSDRKTNIVLLIFTLMWTIHYFNRTFIYPFLIRSGYKKFPVVLIIFAIFFNTINGYINGYYIFFISPIYDIHWLADPRFILGFTLFSSGMIINMQSDRILRNLRKPGSSGYKVPAAGLFKYISCPNYFGEIIEWIGWTIATWSIAGLAFAVFTIANLLPRALSNHRWYRYNFSDYPEDRRALIPFIY